jgi:hypothetical protein
MTSAKLSVGKAFLLQAKEDLIATKKLIREDSAEGTAPITKNNIKKHSPSTFFMLLQMVFEKLMKAHKYRNDYQINSARHEGASEHFSKYFNTLYRVDPKHRSKNSYHIIKVIQDLENAQPSIAKKKSSYEPQLEYPWENARGEICYPARDLPLVQKLNDNNFRIQVLACLKFAEAYANKLMTAL